MAEKQTKLTGWGLWLLWVLASALGAVAGIAGGLAVRRALNETAAWLIIGLCIGALQWLVLRRTFRLAAWWIVVSGLGAALAFAIAGQANDRFMPEGPLNWVLWLGFLLAGALSGLGQWLELRQQTRGAGWWVPAGALSWLAGGLLMGVIKPGLAELPLFMIRFAAFGLIIGAGTGLVLVLSGRSPASSVRAKGPAGRLAFAGFALLMVMAGITLENMAGRLAAPPDLASRPACPDLPPLECAGDDAYCSQVVFFEPVNGPGYVNYPVADETADNQYRSYLTRDLLALIQYATASVACETQNWNYLAPLTVLGLGDMSEADGSIPGTSTGQPGHPQGVHENGWDIDVAYYQSGLSSLQIVALRPAYEGSLIRPVCRISEFGQDVYHCVAPPHRLDAWRTALFIARLSEHPRLRVVGVDGQIGPVIEAALDALVQAGWVDPGLRADIRLAYDQSSANDRGWYLFHFHKMHISMNSH